MGTGAGVTVTPCPRCGRLHEADARFCAGCGLDLDATVTPAPQLTPTPPGPPSAAPPPPPAAFGPVPAPVPGSAAPARAGIPPAEPAAVGRRASPLGWAAVLVGTGLFLAAALGVIVVAGDLPGAGPAAGTEPGGVPAARFDRTLYDGTTVAEGEPFEIEVEAVNGADAATAPLWLVIDWQPDDLAATPGVRGAFAACDPDDCTATDETVAGRTVVSWPGLDAGERHVLRVTVSATGIEPGTTLWYRVSTGSGASPDALTGGFTWDLDLEVE